MSQLINRTFSMIRRKPPDSESSGETNETTESTKPKLSSERSPSSSSKKNKAKRGASIDDAKCSNRNESLDSMEDVQMTDEDKIKRLRSSSKDAGFVQWQEAMRMVVRLPGGIPHEFRKKLWITLSERYIKSQKINWTQTVNECFNEKSDPDDESLGEQIIKDLHRTGCSLFCGNDAEHNQALLKQVLVAYARFNKNVGYCQGFNILAAVILEVVEWDVEDSLMVMIYLIEGLLPESYFANNLRGLSVDMAVFRDLLKIRLPTLSNHLDQLQYASEDSGVSCYEPPLINVFTLQWFLTLFCNCLPKDLVLRIWDLIFLEGNEILLRTALSIWDILTSRILEVKSPDDFYSTMGILTHEMMEFEAAETNELIKNVLIMAPFPFPRLNELREKYTYNIRPPATKSSGTSAGTSYYSNLKKGITSMFNSSEDEDEEDPEALIFDEPIDPITANWLGLSTGVNIPSSPMNPHNPSSKELVKSNSLVTGGTGGVDPSRMTLDVSLLKKQYSRLRERQKQAHVILSEGFRYAHSSAFNRGKASGVPGSVSPVPINHLLAGKPALTAKKPKRPSPVVNMSHNHPKLTSSFSSSSSTSSSSATDKPNNNHHSSKSTKTNNNNNKEQHQYYHNYNRRRSNNNNNYEDEVNFDDDHYKSSKRNVFPQTRRKSATNVTRVEVVQPPSDTKKHPKRTFEPVIKTRHMISRRASSIEPRDARQLLNPDATESKDETNKKEVGETLSWSEIRKKRKTSAPLIKVILKEEPSPPDEKSTKSGFEADSAPKTFEEAVKLLVDSSASSSAKSSPIAENPGESSTDAEADEPQAVPEDDEEEDRIEEEDDDDMDAGHPDVKEGAPEFSEEDDEYDDGEDDASGGGSTDTELCDGDDFTEGHDESSSSSPELRRKKHNKSVRMKSPKASIEKPDVLREEESERENEESTGSSHEDSIFRKVAQRVLDDVLSQTNIELRCLIKTAKGVVDDVLKGALVHLDSEKPDVVLHPVVKQIELQEEKREDGKQRMEQRVQYPDAIETLWEESEEEVEDQDLVYCDADENIEIELMSLASAGQEIIMIEEDENDADVEFEDDDEGNDDHDDLSEKSVSQIVLSVKRELSNLSVDECIKRFSEKISTLSESCD